MPKAKKVSARKRRLADKLKKRNQREKQSQDFLGGTQACDPESVVSCETSDGAKFAPPGNFPGQGSIGLPPVEGKPLARVQASLREKMHSPAPRLPSPRGSRLIVQKGKAPSTDSPPWVCAPPRAPGPDTVHVSGPAGQARLDTSWKEETSRKLKDEGYLNDIKKESQSNTNGILNKKLDTVENMSRESINMMECRHNGEMKENVTTNKTKLRIEMDGVYNLKEKNVEQTDRSSNVEKCEYSQNIGNVNEGNCQKGSTGMQITDDKKNTHCNVETLYSTSIQGSFHQADPLFGDTAGTQCVANCLAGLAYNVLKSAVIWQTTDMNKILVTGDELYTYLQRCSSITNRYLLVEELPQLFECFNKTFDFTVKVVVPSLISLSEEEPCYEDFNAYSLFEGLQMALTETNGCFVCFGGNTLVIGKTNDGFFIFDSHARCSRGYLSVTGKSTRILLKEIQDVYMHLRLLAVSMGFSRTVECELSGVLCSLKHFAVAEVYERENEGSNQGVQLSSQSNDDGTRTFSGAFNNSEQDLIISDQSEMTETNEVIFMREELRQHDFIPLSIQKQRKMCKQLGLPYSVSNCERNSVSVKDIDKPSQCKEIEQDGNCFFRAISFSLTNSENFHQHIREAVCEHLLKHETKFQQLMRSEGCLRQYLLSSKMTKEGTWATELEISAVSDMLSVDIFTYSDMKWLQFSKQGPYHEMLEQEEAIYLDHKQQNHYDVVLNVSARMSEKESVIQNRSRSREYTLRRRNRIRMKTKRTNLQSKVATNFNESRKNAFREKYNECEEFKLKTQLKSKERYYNDNDYRSKLIQRGVQKYALDLEHRKKVQTKSRKKSKVKYSTDLNFRNEKKKKSVKKYEMDAQHRNQMKEKSVKKYRTDYEHQEKLKKASTDKYKTDLQHQTNVKKASSQKYRTDSDYRKKLKRASTEKYRTDLEHQEKVKKRSNAKYKRDLEHKAIVKERVLKKYKEDETYRMKKKAANVQRYRTNETFRANVQERAVWRYQTDAEIQAKMKKRSRTEYQFSEEVRKKKKEEVTLNRKLKQNNLEQEEVIRSFKRNAMEGPNYVCTCCHRLLFKKQVQACDSQTYQKSESAKCISEICLLDKYLHECSESCPKGCTKSSLWICYTCHRKIMSGKAPAEAVVNGMILEDVPPELTKLNSLEQHLIAIHIPFMKIMALPHGQQRNIHGPVICVPSDMRKAASLPMHKDENLLLRVKLKRKLNYKGYFEYQFVNTNNVMSALSYLKENNYWYKDIKIESTLEEGIARHENIPEDVVNSKDNVEDEEEMVAFDTCLQPIDVAQEVLDHYFDDVYDIAPGEGKNPVRMLQEPGNEAKAFPCHFPSGRFSWNEERSEKLTLSRYFNNRLMNADNRFAKDSNYIFFSQYMSELNQVIEKTQISLRKSLSKCTSGKPVTLDMLQDPMTLSRLLRNDDAIRFMQPIRGTPAYWATAQKDLFAMLRQLGIPTWFCSFSAAEYRWNDAVKVILQQQNDGRNPDEMEWSEKNDVLRSNPVTVARMFEHRFQIFHKEVILSPAEPIGKVVDYFQRVEFQQRGSPHMHCLYWVENAPNIDSHGVEAVCTFIDRYVTCSVPTESSDGELRESVLEVQQHSKKHSKSCRKKGTECRFNFPRPPSKKTFITSVQEEDNSDDCKIDSETNVNEAYAKDILVSVWDKIQNQDEEILTTEKLFDDLSLTQELYEEAHNILSSKRSIILKRCPNEVWTNQYNRCLLKSWDANMDIQFVLDAFSCIVYIVSYISKSEREMGMLLKQTKLEAEEGNYDARQTMKKIGSAYLHHREVSAQEAVYRVCNLKMKESSRKVVFVPVGDNPVRLSKPLSLLKKKSSKDKENEEEDDENEVWMTNIIERYMNRPEKQIFQEMCLADFCSEFRVLAKSQVPKKENENVYELQNGKGYVQRRTRTQHAVVRYPRFNVEKMSEKYYQSLLQLFLPYWTDAQLKPPGFDLYQDFYETGYVKISGSQRKQSVKSIVDLNHSRYAKNENEIDNAQEAYEVNGEPEDAWSRICPETEVLRREGMAFKKDNTVPQEDTVDVIPDIESENHNADVMYRVQQNTNSREEMIPVLQNLNETQREIFYMVRDWCLAKITGENCEPLHLFVTGGAGTGKSHLIKAIHYEASRLLSRIMSDPERISVLLAAFTGTAAFNIGGNTIHHLFSLTKYLSLPYEPLGEQSLSELRVKIGDLHILIIDEISMVYKKLLYYIHERLVQIKKCREPFGGVCVIAVGDFYQLPPVKQRKDERLYKENMAYPMDYWLDLFKVIELKEIMRQRDDLLFAEVLNSLRVRERDEPFTQEQSTMLQDCIREGPEDVLHVFSTNEEVNTFNLTMLNKSCEDLLEINAEDYKKDKTSGKLILKTKPMTKSRTDGLPSTLILSIGAKVMLTRNCNVEDGLVNGVMGHICRFAFKENSNRIVSAVGIVFDNKQVGKKSGQKTKDGNLVFIERVQDEIKDKITTVVRHQFPIRLSWACTAHKVQGMTTDKVVVNLDRAFAPGQGYVALSRVSSKAGLFIDTDDPVRLRKNVYADPEVKTALNEMDKISFDNISRILNSNGKKIVLHNIQSLGSHFADLRNDARFKEADVICLTETWLRSGQNIENFALQGFQFHHLPRKEAYEENTVSNQTLRMSKGGGVALYLKDGEDSYDILSLSRMNIEGIAVKLLKENILLLSVYRPPIANMATFLQNFQKVLDFLKATDRNSIILGDFNEDAKVIGPLQEFLRDQNFRQIVSFSTTEGGTILDHVYVSSSIQIGSLHRLPTYYSYHDAVLLNLQSK